MDVAVVGANGGVGRRLVSRLAEADHHPIGMVRSDDQFDRVRDNGGEPRLGDLEAEFAEALQGADAVVFTAGSGPDTGMDKTLMVDLWGARRTIDACADLGIDRFVMVSSRGVHAPLEKGRLAPYLVAKRAADDHLKASSLDYTILRPTRLTDDEATGRIECFFEAGGQGDPIPRGDVANAAVACLEDDATIGEVIELFGGDTPVEQAVSSRD